MKNSLKVKKTINCETCGCKIIKTKTIKVESETKEDAIQEAKIKAIKWSNKIAKQNCKICKSIINTI